jgi:hypothetical protein
MLTQEGVKVHLPEVLARLHGKARRCRHRWRRWRRRCWESCQQPRLRLLHSIPPWLPPMPYRRTHCRRHACFETHCAGLQAASAAGVVFACSSSRETTSLQGTTCLSALGIAVRLARHIAAPPADLCGVRCGACVLPRPPCHVPKTCVSRSALVRHVFDCASRARAGGAWTYRWAQHPAPR